MKTRQEPFDIGGTKTRQRKELRHLNNLHSTCAPQPLAKVKNLPTSIKKTALDHLTSKG
jgi:hypothetical protein